MSSETEVATKETVSEDEQTARTSFGRRSTTWLVTTTVLFTALGMADTFWWPAVVRHHSYYWLTPSDIWSTVRGANFVRWGGLSYIYSYHSTLVTLPGFNIVLVPVASLCSALGLSESSLTVYLFKPSSWYLIGPFCIGMSFAAFFSLDALARFLRFGLGSRRLLTLATAVAIWPALVMWGHPEDVVALGLTIYSLLALSKDRMTLAGWLLGAAVAMQLYVVLVIPIFLGATGIRKALPLLARAAVFPGFLLVAVLAPDFHNAIWSLTKQPGFPLILHPTPWILLAPHIASNEVSNGPVHSVALVAAAGLGFVAHRWRRDWVSLFWLVAVATGIRCLFEPVMVPYYVMPAVAISFTVGRQRGHLRWLLTLAAGTGLTVMTFYHPNMWAYWFEMAGLMAAMFAFAKPARLREPDAEESELLQYAPARALSVIT